ncbi:MAG TPA: hypothetical protein PLN11_07770, partial [Ottowia sp.]|nr:hypothetical protein [Ottowia sp.]
SDWAKDRTLVVVTHRLQVLPFVQRIIVLDQGRVVMDGPRDAVLARLRGVAGAPGVGGQPTPAVPNAETPAPGVDPAVAATRPQVRVIRIGGGAAQPTPAPQGDAGVA